MKRTIPIQKTAYEPDKEWLFESKAEGMACQDSVNSFLQKLGNYLVSWHFYCDLISYI